MALYILGISAYYHDSAACVVKNGEILAAAQEERFTRKKHDFRFPAHAVEYCLDEAGISVRELDAVGFYENPSKKFNRILTTYEGIAPRGFGIYQKSLKSWLERKIWILDQIKKELDYPGRIHYAEHHASHASSAFFPSPFENAAILTVDGVGEWATTTFGQGSGNTFAILKELNFPHSLGLLYSAFTYYTGFRVNSGEYKVMGLAPYGDPCYVDIIKEKLVKIKDDGSFRLNMDYFGYLDGNTMTNNRFNDLFGGPPRQPESPLSQKEMDLARSVQDVTEEILAKMCNFLHEETQEENLCMAGGVALNCVANGKLLKRGPFKNIWIQPAAGDAGGAIGVALYLWHKILNNKRSVSACDGMKGSYLGPSYSDEKIQEYLNTGHIPYTVFPGDTLFDQVADVLREGNVVGWFQGRMEFGPRALGNRSIIADSRNTEMQKKLNLKIKFRESFRPFAPSVIREDVSDYFDLDCDSPYMLIVANVKKARTYPMNSEQNCLFGIDKLNVIRSDIPAVTHVDYSARIQTVHDKTNPRYHKLITAFKRKTGYSVLVNTSFNVRGEPIVCSPAEAYQCFMRTQMDVIALGNCILYKKDQPSLTNDSDWRSEFTLD